MRSVIFVALKRPGWFCIITRPSPELFGLIEATSNAGAAGVACGACAPSRDALNAPTTSGIASAPRAVAVVTHLLHDRGQSDETLFIGASLTIPNHTLRRQASRIGRVFVFSPESGAMTRTAHRAERRDRYATDARARGDSVDNNPSGNT